MSREPANFLAAPAPDFFLQAAPAPDFFSPSESGSGSWYFLERLRLQEAKKPAPALDYWLSLAKYSFSLKPVR